MLKRILIHSAILLMLVAGSLGQQQPVSASATEPAAQGSAKCEYCLENCDDRFAMCLRISPFDTCLAQQEACKERCRQGPCKH